MKSLILFLFAFCGWTATAGIASRIVDKASNYRSNLSRTALYGSTWRNGLTGDGRLACARVVQIVMCAARTGYGMCGAKYSVNQIERAVRSWKKITNPREIRGGDVVFWHKRGQDKICSGGGDCHVGLAISSRQILNTHTGLGRGPRVSGVGIGRFRFMYARRPPN